MPPEDFKKLIKKEQAAKQDATAAKPNFKLNTKYVAPKNDILGRFGKSEEGSYQGVIKPAESTVGGSLMKAANYIDRDGKSPVGGLISEPIKSAARLISPKLNYLDKIQGDSDILPVLTGALTDVSTIAGGLGSMSKLPKIAKSISNPTTKHVVMINGQPTNIIKPQSFNWDDYNTPNNAFVDKKGLLSKVKEKVGTAMDKKFIPAGTKQTLPNKIKFETALYGGDEFAIRAVGEDGRAYGVLELEPHTTHGYRVNGIDKTPEYVSRNANSIFAQDANGYRINNIEGVDYTTEWTKPNMIKVADKMQGKKLQDVLYQLGIEESKIRGLKGIRSGDHLLSPAKTVKAHNRFEKQVLDMKSTDGVDHLVAGLTQHKNPNLVNDWLENYSKLKKTEPVKMSINDVGNTVKKNPGLILKPAAVVAGAFGASYAIGETANALGY